MQDVRAGLNAYRVLVSDLVVAVDVDDAQAAAIRELKDIPIVRCELRLEPVEPVEGRVAVFAAGPAPTDHLEVGRRRQPRQTLRIAPACATISPPSTPRPT